MYKVFFLFFVFILVNSTFASRYLIQLKAEDPRKLSDHLEEQGFDVAGVNTKTFEVGVITEFPFLLTLEQKKIENLPTLSFVIISETLSEPYNSYAARVRGALDENDYFGPEESNKSLKQIEQAFPLWAKVYNLNRFTETPKTAEGREIFALQISENPSQIEDKAKILIIGQHHARELTTQHAVIDSARDFLESVKRGDTAATSALKNTAIWFVPVLNPDGLNYVLNEDRMWRKNRSLNTNGTRGVDLNRNYGFKWGSCGLNSNDTSSEVYKGPRSMSEPEMQLMDKLNQRLHFQYSISYHSYGNEVLNPYLCGSMVETTVYNRLADLLALTLQFSRRQPSSSGEDHEFHYNKFGTLSFLIEIGDVFQPSFSTYRNEVWPGVQKVLPFILKEVMQTHVQFQVLDEETSKPLSAKLSLAEIVFKEGEVRETDSFGTYRWTLPTGNYTLNVSTNGYEQSVVQFHAMGGLDKVLVRLKKHQDFFSWFPFIIKTPIIKDIGNRMAHFYSDRYILR